jgi:putative transposase
MKELILEKQAGYGYTVIEMEVMQDHVHLLLDVDPRKGINQVVAKIKGYTSHELRDQFPYLKKRLPTLWTRSKFISTVGAVTLEVVQGYIENQKNV